jgi:competence protein ComEC
LGGADVEILHPPRDGTAVESENDRSLVARVSWPGMNVLLTGDIERAAETALAEAPGLADALRADVLKVPHHGSRTSSSEEFIDTVAPAVAVISVGPRGRRSVLSRDVVARYKSDGVTVLRTDVVGGVRFRTGPNGALRVEPARVMRGYVVRDEPGRVSHS